MFGMTPWEEASAKKPNEFEMILKEVWKLIKIYNNYGLKDIVAEDLIYISENLQSQYKIEIVRRALGELKLNSLNKDLTLGIFLEKCAEVRKREQTYAATQAIGKPYLCTPKIQSREKIAELKQMLATAVKPLPYSKSVRVWGKDDSEPPKVNGDIELKNAPSTEFYKQNVQDGVVAPSNTILDPELRDLYTKAWSVGLSREEKDRMVELSNTGYQSVSGC